MAKSETKSVSIASEEVKPRDWAEKVYKIDIVHNWEKLYKKPGYTMCTRHPCMHVSCENNVALVTGAGSGRGLATATAFAEAGASVVLAGQHEALKRMTRVETVGFAVITRCS